MVLISSMLILFVILSATDKPPTGRRVVALMAGAALVICGYTGYYYLVAGTVA